MATPAKKLARTDCVISIESNSRRELFYGYALAGGLMVGAGLLAYRIGVSAERRPLEEIAPPLSMVPGEGPL